MRPPHLQLEQERLFQEQQRELRGMLARYRGPLLEATIDLEQRVYHLLVQADGGLSSSPDEEVSCPGPHK